MDVSAKLTNVRISPQKARWVADQIRGKKVDKALEILNFSLKKGGAIIKKILESAIANAENNASLDVDDLKVKTIFVDQGPTYKRMMPRAKGRGDRILKRTSHITVTVADNQEKA